MDSIQKEAMTIAMELKRILSLRLCDEITDDQYRLQRERLMKDFNIATRKVMLCGQLETVLWPSSPVRRAGTASS